MPRFDGRARDAFGTVVGSRIVVGVAVDPLLLVLAVGLLAWRLLARRPVAAKVAGRRRTASSPLGSSAEAAPSDPGMTVIDDYLVLFSWLFVAIGAALLGGTGMALLHYRRTGSFPGQPEVGKKGQSVSASPRTAIAKCLIGGVLIVWGLTSLVVRAA